MGHEDSKNSSAKGRKTHSIIFIFLTVLTTNLLTYIITSSINIGSSSCGSNITDGHLRLTAFSQANRLSRVSELLFHLNHTQEELDKTKEALFTTQARLQDSMQVNKALQENISLATDLISSAVEEMLERGAAYQDNNLKDGPWLAWSTLMNQQSIREFFEYVAPRKLPLGWSLGLASNTMISPVGHACALHAEDLQKFMTYNVGGLCPDDQDLAQRLLLHGCEPLPRRRCFARSPENYTDPYPFPGCTWTTPPDRNIHWTAYSCKSFECLNERKNHGVSADCLDCFELQGREKRRWLGSGGGTLDYTVEEVLAYKNGSIRIGLDIGGGTGSFAARMREQDVTVVTTTMNFDGPFNSMIALRGMVPIFMSIAQRFPFFDNTLDIVHSMHVLSNWIPLESLEFILYDIDRILRPGGIFWLDHFFCIRHELTEMYVPMIEKLSYKKLRWAVGDKLDRGADKQEVYLSALLEKPYSRS